jgi:hypothetical protein
LGSLGGDLGSFAGSLNACSDDPIGLGEPFDNKSLTQVNGVGIVAWTEHGVTSIDASAADGVSIIHDPHELPGEVTQHASSWNENSGGKVLVWEG